MITPWVFYTWDHMFPKASEEDVALAVDLVNKRMMEEDNLIYQHGTSRDYVYFPQNFTKWSDPARAGSLYPLDREADVNIDRAIRNSPVQCPDLDQEPADMDEEMFAQECREGLQSYMGRESEPWVREPHPIDAVRHPEHYQSSNQLEAIEVIEAFGLNYNLGNVVKYVLRAKRKGGDEDLRKARNYLHREITGEWLD